KRYLKLIFSQDTYGYLPQEAFIPYTKEVEELSLEQVLKTVILFNNHSERPDQPILLDYEEEEQLFEFKWMFWQKGSWMRRTWLLPEKSLKEYGFVFKPTEEVDPDGTVRRIQCAEILIRREAVAVKREAQIQVAHLRITG
ncbi:MAG: hypothetical protein AAF206_13990, partial [Bacteroidota bacterium]